jgi:hypothetical protein
MMRQGVFLADGPSDLPLARHLEWICAEAGTPVTLTPLDPRFLRTTGRTVVERLEFLIEQQSVGDIVFVHRDAEREPPHRRVAEIEAGRLAAGLDCPVVPVVPVRMTEAWLLLDDAAIRRVAGKPNGRRRLNLPTPAEAERIADPKTRLRDVLTAASETAGRRRTSFVRDFDRHRALLIERLDPTGPVATLSAWQRLLADTAAALSAIDAGGAL